MPKPKSPWAIKNDERVAKLNVSPETQMFEVGTNGTLLGGDIELAKSPGDEFEATIHDVKPGIWTITKKTENDQFQNVLIRWAAPGPLDFDNIPGPFPDPNLNPLSDWEEVARYSVDSGTHGLLCKDNLQSLIASAPNGGRQYVIEKLSDYCYWERSLSVMVGFVVGGDDGGYRVKARSHEGVKVVIMVEPNFDEEEEE